MANTPQKGEGGMQWCEGTGQAYDRSHLVAGGLPRLQLLQAEAKEGEDNAGEEDHEGEEGDRTGGT